MNGCWALSNDFYASVEMLIWFLSFLLLMWCMTLTDLGMVAVVNLPCELGMNPTWSWYMIFLICCSIWLATILLRIFVSTFIKDIGL